LKGLRLPAPHACLAEPGEAFSAALVNGGRGPMDAAAALYLPSATI